MLRVLTIALVAAFAIYLASCSPCKKMERTNQKLIAGKHDFGKGKEAKKYKRKQRY